MYFNIALTYFQELRHHIIAQPLLPREKLRVAQPVFTTKRRHATTALILLRNQTTPLRPRFRPALSHGSRVTPPAASHKMGFA